MTELDESDCCLSCINSSFKSLEEKQEELISMYFCCCFLFFPPLAFYLMFKRIGRISWKVIGVSTVLTFFCWIPGVIHGLVKFFKLRKALVTFGGKV